MAQNKQDGGAAVEALKASIAANQLGSLYVFHGAERYLLEIYVDQIRKKLTGGAFSEFNHRRFEGQGFTVDELSEAVDTLPAFADRTLLEVYDFDLFKGGDETKQKLLTLISGLPEYVCLIFIYDTLEWKPDGRLKLTEEIKKRGAVVEFTVQEQSKLVKWIKNHFTACDKSVDTATAEYLAELTGGLMTTLNTEIDKVCSYTRDRVVTRAHIDAVVTPSVEAVVFRLADHIAAGSFSLAASTLYDLLSQREEPQFLIYLISQKMRQLLTARLCIENGLGDKELLKLGAVKSDWQARNLMTSARKMTVEECRRATLMSAMTAFRMLKGGTAEDHLTELLISLAENRRRARV
jgi:DNA polymerase-3 subunit delta